MSHAQPEGHLAVPPTGKGPGILVLHAWWGLNDTIRGFLHRLAEPASSPSPQTSITARSQTTLPTPRPLSMLSTPTTGRGRHRGCRSVPQRACRPGRPRPGSDRLLAGRLLRAGSLGRRSRARPFRRPLLRDRGRRLQRSRAAYLGHFAENDEFEPQSNVDELEAALQHAGRPVTFYRYSGTGHWFFEPDRPQAYNQAAASLAWDRTLAFLKRSM